MIIQWQGDDAAARAYGIIGTCMAAGMEQVAMGACWAALTAPGIQCISSSHDIVIGSLRYNRSDARLIQGGQGRPAERAGHLCIQEWGAYLAVFVDDDLPWLMLDPSGAIPGWRMNAGDLMVVTDGISPALARAVGMTAEINQPAVAASLVSPASAIHLACIRGIEPLVPGMLYGPDGLQQPIWRPEHHTYRHVDNPSHVLRRAVDEAAYALAEPSMLFQLSGGLDSSILLTALAARGVHPLTMNFATGDAGGDERHYARLVAQHADVDLVEVGDAGFPDYRRIADARQGAAPHVFGLDDAFEGAVDAIVAEHGVTSVMTGQGGDAVFFQPATTLVSVDHARAGVDAAFWRALPDAARRTRSSLWPHLLAVMRDRLGFSTVPTDMLGPAMLTTEALDEALNIDRRHPWSRDIDYLPPGKRMQIVMIANSQIFHHARATGSASLHHPLLTQPVLEAVLGIPTFALAQGTNDRGLARKVFSDRLPPALVARRSKGDASDHYSRAALANLSFLREFLLDGRLVAMGILRREALETLLTREALFFSPEYRGLAMQVSCEAWARAWTA